MLERINQEVPQKPGCYLYFNANKEVIYVGKAKILKKRMQSYFNRSHDIKTQKLVSEIVDFKFYITSSENESLILERNLIRKYNPRYNILLKDDKSYPYILVTNEKFARVLKVRDKKIKGEYFGPYPNAKFVNDVIEYINKNTQLRVCAKMPNKECLYYHIGQCYGPCVKEYSEEDAKKYKNEVLALLRNNMKSLKKEVEYKMQLAAENQDFENASKYRDIVIEIESNSKRQAVQLNNGKSFDVLSYYKDDNWIAIAIVSVVDGIVNNINTSLQPYFDDYKQTFVSYLYEYYEKPEQIPPILVEDSKLGEFVSQTFVTEQINSHLTQYRTLEEIASENAQIYYKNNIEKITKLFYEGKNTGFSALQNLANDNLNVIEMFDVSHHQGSSQVAGKVVYIDGKRNPKLYRKYKIKEANKKDEYGSMREVIERRVKRIITDEETPPNLIVLDGGKAQVSIGNEILVKYGLADKIKLIGLVKDDKHVTRGIVNKDLVTMDLDRTTQLYKFLYQMQEEVHRYAIDYHNTAQKNTQVLSTLDKIEGLGPKRKKALLAKFQTIENVKNANIDDLTSSGLPHNVAQNVVKYFEINE